MKKLLLIYPKMNIEKKRYAITSLPPIGLAYIAAQTPRQWEVTIIDEYIDEVPMDYAPDLVGITVYTYNAFNAYKWANRFKEEATPVVLGGIHVSMLPEEALTYCDTIVVGEGESVWPQVIADFENGTMRREYIGERLPLDSIPPPRRDLFSEKYDSDIIQTTRGCPFNCNFCSVTAFNGHKQRRKSVDAVLEEMKTIKSKYIFMADDNIFGNGGNAAKRSIELFKGMINSKINKYWMGQASINVADNEDVLKYAYKSGCRGLFIGLESVSDDNLRDMKKSINRKGGVEYLKNAIKVIHKHGILVEGSFILGNDHDNIHSFRQLYKFVKDAGIDVLMINCLTPYPGTQLYSRMEHQGLLIYNNYPEDWNKYTCEDVVFKPENMSVYEFVQGFEYLIHKLYPKRTVFSNTLNTLLRTRKPMTAIFSYLLTVDTIKTFTIKQNLFP